MTGDTKEFGSHCDVTDGCITCGDVAVEVTVLSIDGPDALCGDGQGRSERIALELLDDVSVGDRLLAHAGVALQRLDDGGTRAGRSAERE